MTTTSKIEHSSNSLSDDDSKFEHVEIELAPALLASGEPPPSSSSSASFSFLSAKDSRNTEWSQVGHFESNSSISNDFEKLDYSGVDDAVSESSTRVLVEPAGFQKELTPALAPAAAGAAVVPTKEVSKPKIDMHLGKEIRQSRLTYSNAETEILQLLLCQCIDVAADEYKTNIRLLSDESKAEISLVAQQHFAKDVVDFYFQDLALEQFEGCNEKPSDAANDTSNKSQQAGKIRMETAISDDASAKLRFLFDQVQESRRKVEIAKIKSEIIQLLIQNNILAAGDVYQKNKETLCNEAKCEISAYAHCFLDDAVVDFYFPNLPQSALTFADFDERATKTLEQLEWDLVKAEQELDKHLIQVSQAKPSVL
jgi:hypothetical protein